MVRRAQLEAARNATIGRERRAILAARPEAESIVVELRQQSSD
jgi:hypothetical protein